MKTIYKSAGIIIDTKKLLVTRTKGNPVFFAPGGKRQDTETDKQAAVRELHEELTIQVQEDELSDFGTWEAPATNMPDTTLVMHVFMVHSFTGTISPSNEIEEVRWITSQSVQDIELGSIFRDYVIPKLHQMNLID